MTICYNLRIQKKKGYLGDYKCLQRKKKGNANVQIILAIVLHIISGLHHESHCKIEQRFLFTWFSQVKGSQLYC